MLIGLLGNKGSGKSTVADYLVKTHGFIEKSFADPLKKACQELFLFDDQQVYGDINAKETPDARWFNCTPRKVLQFIGTDLLRNQIGTLIPELGQDIFIHHFRLWYQSHSDEKNIVISDVRFQNEADLIVSLGGIIIRIDRNSNLSDIHESEMGVGNIKCDYVVANNSSIDSLCQKINQIIGFQ